MMMLSLGLLAAAAIDGSQTLARPTPAQYRWHEQERIMFVHFDPATWQGHEYDDHSTPLSQINPTKLDTDQWCRAAKLWGAKQIILVAKHGGGFCWWQTSTSDYSIKKAAWKNGKGDVLAELAASCQKHKLALGVYVYPGDGSWGAGIGSGGRTSDPEKQEAYNKVYRQQLTEVLTKYGTMAEVWFDGSCAIDVSDILAQYAKDAAIFQGPQATIRWPGSESGKISYPAWNTLKKSDLATGVATQEHDDPNGDAWAPHECDTPLYDHNWFWSKENESRRKSLDELVDVYLKSVGYGAVMLLNSTPNTDGLIPDGDMKLYAALGKELRARFGTPLKAAINQGKSKVTEISFPGNTDIDCLEIMEDYRQGHRIRGYAVEGLVNGAWIPLAKGSAVGRKRLQMIQPQTVESVRLTITDSIGKPLVRRFAVYNTRLSTVAETEAKPDIVGEWTGNVPESIDLSDWVRKPGKYLLTFQGDPVQVTDVAVYIGKVRMRTEFVVRKPDGTWTINRTDQVTKNTPTVLQMKAVTEGKVRLTIKRMG